MEAFEGLAAIALEILEEMPEPVVQVCGPITNGGLGSVEKNLAKIGEAIRKLEAEGKNVFSQLPFEGVMHRIKETPYYRGENHLLEAFYLPIFESGLVKTLYFVEGWESSYGACWEHGQAFKLNLGVEYL